MSEFFRFIGVFIHEDILFERKEDKTDFERDTRYNAYVYIGVKSYEEGNTETLSKLTDETEYSDLVNGLSGDVVYFYGEKPVPKSSVFEMGEADQKQYLKDVMDAILYKISQKIEREQYKFEDMISIYVQRKLFLHSINMQYYPKSKSSFMRTAKESFIDAQKDLESLTGTAEYGKNMSTHYWYARIWTKVKANIACGILGDILYFSEEKMFHECEELIEEHPDFTNAKVLLGLCYEPLKHKTKDAAFAFYRALCEIKRESYSASVYYFLGKKYEADGRYSEEQKLCYKASNKRSVKFRALFKLGENARREKRYDDALYCLNMILSKLQSKKEIGYLDPLEMEYISKAYLQKSIISSMRGEMEKMRTNLDQAKEEKKAISNNMFYEILYNDDAPRYRKESEGYVDIEYVEKLLKVTS